MVNSPEIPPGCMFSVFFRMPGSAAPGDKVDRDDDLLRRKRRVMDPVADELDRDARFILQVAVHRTDRLCEVDVSEDIVKADDVQVVRHAEAIVFQQGNGAPGFHITEGEQPVESGGDPGFQLSENFIRILQAGIADILLRNAGIQAGLPEAREALAGGEDHLAVGQHGHFAVTGFDQVAGSQVAAFLIVTVDTVVPGSFLETACLHYGDLAYSLGQYGKAFGAYQRLKEVARLDDNRLSADMGMMRSAFRAREYDDAIAASGSLRSNRQASAAQRREAEYLRAKSCLGMSRRAEAYGIFEQLAKEPSTAEGAEAAYLIIQDQFDRADFAGIEDKVYDFAAKAGGQNYWLAKAFIVLGDTFAENGNMTQAKATFESIKSGYKPSGPEDEVLDQVNLRLRKL